ncbi:MAG: hypothetical protein HC852_10125 [Acaryochloridaceae cyanobacterium RU_4_10]|nr:hypothetical protein [Acaryochloridaceae cyanobacterium RU_4_10]
MSQIRIYHRLESPTQTPAIAQLQKKSMELWGSPPHNTYQSDIPKVKAYEGSLPKRARGIEFTTDIEPDSGTPPGKGVCWSNLQKGVRIAEKEDGRTYAIIKVLTLVNHQL